jgi:hypothetical protein
MLTLLGGCEDVRRDFMPLEAGSVWTYRVRSGGRDLGAESLEVLERIVREGDAEAGAPGGPLSRFRVREPGATAVWVKEGKSVLRVTPRTATTIIQHPPFVDSGWTDRAEGGSLVYCRIVAREAVETPAGAFRDCLVVRREAEERSSVVTQWFAPDVGLVRWRVERPRAPAVERVLDSYRPGGG